MLNHRRTKRLICLTCLLLLAPSARPLISASNSATRMIFPDEIAGNAASGTPEQRIVAAIQDIRDGRMNDALATVNALIELEPNYRLAYLIQADLYAMRAMSIHKIGGGADAATQEQLEDFRREALARYNSLVSPVPASQFPANILQFSDDQKYAVVVDASTSRLFVFQNDNGIPRQVSNHYVTVGKLGTGKTAEGDQRTPLGVYFVTSHTTREQLDKTYGALADLYGIGAWPISYPNELDRSLSRKGHGIWLHGSPAATYARPPQASNGCVVLTNPDMQDISQYLQVGSTPVVITPRIEWLSESEWQTRHQKALDMLTSWETSWEKLDTTSYLNFYGKDFRSAEGLDIGAWRKQKTAVHAGKRWARVHLNRISVFSSGEDSKELVSTFQQDYESEGVSDKMKKRLYWQKENGQYRIIWEGAANS